MKLNRAFRWFLSGLVTPALLAAEYSIVDLRPGTVTGLNDSGTIVGFAAQHAFYIRNGERFVTALEASFPDQPEISFGLARLRWSKVNDAGLFVGSASLTNHSSSIPVLPTDYRYPIVWNGTGPARILNVTNGTANAVNAMGTVVGSWGFGNVGGAFRYDGTNIVPLEGMTFANDINDLGVIAGTSQSKAAVWFDGVVTILNIDYSFGDLLESHATEINASGQVAGTIRYVSTSSGRLWERGFLWSNGSTEFLGPLEGQYTRVRDVNNSGIAVGTIAGPAENEFSRPFVYRDGELIDLNTLIPNAGWVLHSANAINEAGQIVGQGALNGNSTSFLLNPLVPGQPVPPSIVQQPQGGEFVLGTTVTLSVTATGTDPLSYQWQRGVTDIEGATHPLLTLSGVDASDEAAYRIIVRNAAGEAYSQPATVIIRDPVTSIARYAGLTISGTTGVQYRIESASEVAAPDWSFADYITLTNSTQVWFDLTSGTNPFPRFYRVTRSQP